MNPDDTSAGGESRADEILQIFHKGAEFTRELLKENERLRFQILELEGQPASTDPPSLPDQVKPLQQRIASLEKEKQAFEERIRTVEEENASFAQRYVEIEAENNMLANLYIASFQLHATLEFSEVVQTISEIIINLVGGEEFALYLLDEKEGHLRPVAAESLELSDLAPIPLRHEVVGRCLESGETHIVADVAHYAHDLERPMVVIPLCAKDAPVGAIVLYRLFVQKSAFTSVDYELFRLLGGHAATALSAARLHTLSERKLSTMQGLLDLLTQ